MPSATLPCGQGRISLPSASFSRTRRIPGHTGDLRGIDTKLSARKRRIYKARPICGWRASWSRAHSPRTYHTSYPVSVRRPALSDWASSRPRLATTPFGPSPSLAAPRKLHGDFHPISSVPCPAHTMEKFRLFNTAA